ncbi:hypothetical protein KY289_016618 [Solanum tuberosum]|nr:hypothetical protein KY289_016618 [Solanum tuberosum]
MLIQIGKDDQAWASGDTSRKTLRTDYFNSVLETFPSGSLYIEFYDAMSVPMAIALPGHLLFGQPVIDIAKDLDLSKFAQLEHAKASQSLNCKLEIVGRTIKVSSVAEDVRVQDAGAKTTDFDDDDGGGLVRYFIRYEHDGGGKRSIHVFVLDMT